MGRIYRLAKRQAFFIKRVAVTEIDTSDQIVALIGFATFFFGFAAGALLNLYYISISHPLVHQFRAALTYKSAIFGDGIILPIINMVAAAFILKNWDYIGRKTLQTALITGLLVTAYFHINQGVNKIVNWAMPIPWHWNALGLWHAIYMFSVASFLALFYIFVIRYIKEEKDMPTSAVIVSVGIVFFFFLLRWDYIAFDLASFFPKI